MITNEQREKNQKQITSLQKIIDYDTRDYPIEFIVQKYENQEYIVPSYQRNEVWTDHEKERFIESLLLGYPIPLIFLAEQNEGKLEIVDGVQRISTLHSYLNNKFALKHLEKLTELSNVFFDDLPLKEQRKLQNMSLRIIVLSSKTEMATRIDLFGRLNTSGSKANDSEIRSGVFSNLKFQKLLEELATNEDFRKMINLSEAKRSRKESIELVSRFFAYSNDYNNFQHSVKDFVDNYIQKVEQTWSTKIKKELTKQFLETLKFTQECFPEHFLQNNRNQTPRVRFEAIMAGSSIALKQYPNLKVSKIKTQMLLDSPEFKKRTTSDASNSKPKVKSRIEYVSHFLISAGENYDKH